MPQGSTSTRLHLLLTHTTHPARCCVCLPSVSLQVLAAQRSRGTDLSVLQSFSYSSLQDELQVGWHSARGF